MKGRTREALIPHVWGIAGLGLFACYAFIFDKPTPKDISQVLLQSIGFAGFIAGFLYTSISLLLTLGDGPYVRRIIDMNIIPRLVDLIWKAVRHWVTVAVLSLLIVFADETLTEHGVQVALMIWFYAITMAFTTFILTARRSNEVLKAAMRPGQFKNRGDGGDSLKPKTEEPVTIQ